MPPVELDYDLQDKLLALVNSGKHKEAYYFFRTFCSSMIDLRGVIPVLANRP